MSVPLFRAWSAGPTRLPDAVYDYWHQETVGELMEGNSGESVVPGTTQYIW